VHRKCKFLLPWPKLIISVRGGFSTLPTTAALLGGLAAQEAIKLVTSQYAPLDNTCIVDLVHSTMAKFKL
jgi:amyloid beta precursor protein binding protein 1